MRRSPQRVRDLIRDLIAEGAQAGRIRDDVAPDELAAYCQHALAAAASLASQAAVRRLVEVILAGLRCAPGAGAPGGRCEEAPGGGRRSSRA
jgi:hypothetical protein